MYDLVEDGRYYTLEKVKKIADFPSPERYYPGMKIRHFERMYHCADEFGALVDWNTGEHIIQRGWFCGDRYCPVCTIKRSLQEYSKLTFQMEQFQEEYQYYFLTLTLPNNQDGFREEMDLMKSILRDLGNFFGFDNHKDSLKLCEGLFGSFEITKSDKGWHPHVHLVLAYPKKYIVSSKVHKYVDRNGRQRMFENELVLQCGKKKKILSHESIMQEYIRLIKRKTDKYNERFEDLHFLDICFHPCYNIEDGVNEMTKYLIDFEAIQSADDMFVYIRDSYGMTQRVRRGVFKFTPELKEAHKEYLDKLHEEAEQSFYFIQSDENDQPVKKDICSAQIRWFYNYYILSRVIAVIQNVEFTDRKRRVAVLQRIKCEVDKNGTVHFERLEDKVLKGWRFDIQYTVPDFVNVRFDE